MSTQDFHTLGDWADTDTGINLAVILACDSHGRVLMQMRDDFPHVAKPGQWGLFGGHVESGETTRAAAQREFAEETGLKFDADRFLPFARLHSDDQRRHFIYRLDGEINGAQISLGEGAGFAFVNQRQLDKLAILPAARRVLAYFFALRT